MITVVEKVRLLMDAAYAEGRNTMFSDSEMEAMIQKADEELYQKFQLGR